MSNFLTLNTQYDRVQIALNKSEKLLQTIEIANKLASSNLIPTIDSLIKSHGLTLSDIKFIAINSGPAPFTSLRTTISIANGISFANKIPLVGICSIEALVKENSNSNFDINIALLNAFGKDVYFAINKDKQVEIGVENIEKILETFNQEEKTINFIGNGTELYRSLIVEKLKDKAYLTEKFVLEVDVEAITKLALIKWEKKEFSYKILPIYLKSYSVQTK